MSLHFQFVLMKNIEYTVLTILLVSFSCGFIYFFLLSEKLQVCASQGFYFHSNWKLRVPEGTTSENQITKKFFLLWNT